MVDLGRFAVLVALVAALWGGFAAFRGIATRNTTPVRSAEGALMAAAVALTVSAVALWYAFVTRDFSVEYVAEYSNKALSLPYTLGAFWAGQPGSLLLWAWVLSLYSVAVVIKNRVQHRDLMPHVVGVLSVVLALFAFIVAFASNPFRHLALVPADGQGLNPLLQNYGQLIHPVTIYTGYVGFTIPFAFCIAALATGRLSDTWIKLIRSWTLWSWLFLTAGILFGARWAYVELGWGGYWAWDPVENASLLPWLTATAFLHSVMIQERKGMLKAWNVSLAAATFVLAIFGTFLTRSGVISSVHAFGKSSVGQYLIGATFAGLIVSVLLIVRRWPELRSRAVMESPLSREATFLVNNLLFVAMAFAVLWGTVFPLIAEAVRGVKVSVGPPFFDAVVGPMGIALIALLGVCPLIAWRKASPKNLRRNFLIPLVVSLAGLGVVTFLTGGDHPGVIAVLTFGVFVTATIVLEVVRGAKARHRSHGEGWTTAAGRLFTRNPRRYGGYIVHLGVVVLVAGIGLHVAYQHEYRRSVKVGQTVTVAGYRLTLEKLGVVSTALKTGTTARLRITDTHGKALGVMNTERALFVNQDQPSSRVGIRSTAKEDLYVILESADRKHGVASLRFMINPAVFWIWAGAMLLIAGGLVAAWPRTNRRKGVTADVPRTPPRAMPEPVGV